MDGKAPEVDGRFFVASLPYTQEMWIAWGLGALFYLYGFFFSPFWAIVGLILLFLSTPHPFAEKLSIFKEKVTDPKYLEDVAEEHGLSAEKYWIAESLTTEENSAGEWKFPAPSQHAWNKDEPYSEDKDGALILEHPFMVGAPKPPLLTLRAVYFTLGLFMLQYWGVVTAIKNNLEVFGLFFGILLDDNTKEGLILAIFILIIFGYLTVYLLVMFSSMLKQLISNINMVDMPTSLVESVEMGEVELIGQARPGPKPAVKVFVDDNPEMSCSNLVCFEWVREDFSLGVNSQGRSSASFFQILLSGLNRLLASFSDWLFDRQQVHANETARRRGGVPFLLHDGSGGILVEPSMFKRIRFRDPLQVWNVGDTRWTLYGVRLGDPLYIHGEVKKRSKKDLAQEDLSSAPPSSKLRVVGNEDPPEQKLILIQGTEHSILAYNFSMLETFYLPTFYLAVFFIMGIV
tara:strand:- start:1677 stop:3056 length:1380 start_codon:yes stop_codon:yes gene_type:complete